MHTPDIFFQHKIGESKTGESVELTIKVRTNIVVEGEDKEATISEILIFKDSSCCEEITEILPYLSPDINGCVEDKAQKLVNELAQDILREVA